VKPLKITAILFVAGFVALNTPLAQTQMKSLGSHTRTFIHHQLFENPRNGPHADPSALDSLNYAINAPDAPPAAVILTRKTL
jgi:hypothetical protein